MEKFLLWQNKPRMTYTWNEFLSLGYWGQNAAQKSRTDSSCWVVSVGWLIMSPSAWDFLVPGAWQFQKLIQVRSHSLCPSGALLSPNMRSWFTCVVLWGCISCAFLFKGEWIILHCMYRQFNSYSHSIWDV